MWLLMNFPLMLSTYYNIKLQYCSLISLGRNSPLQGQHRLSPWIERQGSAMKYPFQLLVLLTSTAMDFGAVTLSTILMQPCIPLMLTISRKTQKVITVWSISKGCHLLTSVELVNYTILRTIFSIGWVGPRSQLLETPHRDGNWLEMQKLF